LCSEGVSGRAWSPSELRIKSFEDLQKLWWVLVKERDQISAAKMWARKNNLTNGELNSRLKKVRSANDQVN